MPAITKLKGDIGTTAILADLTKRGILISIPFGDNAPFDLIAYRSGKFERIQCKYTESSNGFVSVKCRSTNGRIDHKYTADEVDWIAVYDKNTDSCYYVPSSVFSGMTQINLRVDNPKYQREKIRYARNFLEF